ncbi:MAG: response regulator [bacterium]|nr:response regulator [bacterium]
MDRHTILCVDDEKSILSLLRRMLRTIDCEVLLAANAQEALQQFQDHTIALIITDYMMPGMTGMELLRHARHISPDTMRILMSAYTDIQVPQSAVNEGEVFRYFTKPWDNNEFLCAIREALDRYEDGRRK